MLLANDNFTRPDASTLGANWTKLSTLSDIQIKDNQAWAGSLAYCVDAYTASGPVSLDHWAQAVVVDTGVYLDGVVVRSDLAGAFYYMVLAAGMFSLGTYIAATFTEIASVAAPGSVASGDTYYMQVVGTAIITRLNGAEVHNVTNSAIDGSVVGGPYPGLFTGNNTIPSMSSFQMGDMVPEVPTDGAFRMLNSR